jgi:hypothetical protein
VLEDGNAHAVYYALFTKHHAEKDLKGLIGLGEWGDDARPEDRLAFPFRIWLKDNSPVVTMVDSSESPWSHTTFLGRLLDRDEALAHPWIKEVFHITDHMITDDPVIKEHLLVSLQ